MTDTERNAQSHAPYRHEGPLGSRDAAFSLVTIAIEHDLGIGIQTADPKDPIHRIVEIVRPKELKEGEGAEEALELLIGKLMDSQTLSMVTIEQTPPQPSPQPHFEGIRGPVT